MNQAEEDALIAKLEIDSRKLAEERAGGISMEEIVRLAIRAAYAQGREDAAKVCESIPSSLIISQSDVGMIQVCAAAIRRG